MHWKTTIAGLAAGGLNLYLQGWGWKQVLLSIAIAALGMVAADGSKVPTTLPQFPMAPFTPKEVAERSHGTGAGPQ